MINNPRVLVDYTGPITWSVAESSSNGEVVVEGKCGQCDTPTANGRVYPRSIMEREIKRLKEKVSKGSAVGSVDHPGDGKSRITDIGHMIKDIWIEDNGSIHGKFKIIEGTRKGRDLAAVLKAGVAVGMSSRGLGSVSSGIGGGNVVGEDFKLSTFDFVVEPAVSDAYPTYFSEDIDVNNITVQDLKARFGEQVKEIEEDAYKVAQQVTESVLRADEDATSRQDIKDVVDNAIEEQKEAIRQEVATEERSRLVDEFGVKLIRAIQEQRSSIEESVRSELASDPSVAGAKLTLEKITSLVSPFAVPVDAASVIAERDEAIETTSAELEELTDKLQESEDLIKHLSFSLYVEQQISGRKDSDSIKDFMGDLNLIEDVDQLKDRLEDAVAKADKVLESAAREYEEASSVQENKIAALKKRGERFRKVVAEERTLVAQQIDGLNSRVEEKLEEMNSRLDESEERLSHERERSTKLQEALNLSVDALEAVKLRNYASDRTVGHPRRDAILKRVESGDLGSVQDINSEAHNLDESYGGDLGGAYERVRRAFGRGIESPKQESVLLEGASQGGIPGLSQLGIDFSDIAPLGKSKRSN